MKPKVAFVVDALPAMGGGERVVLHALDLFPDAPLYTLVYNPAAFANTSIAAHPVVSSFIDHLPHSRTRYRSYLPLMMFAIKQFDLSQFDLVISFSYAVAHAVRMRPGQRHLSYTYTPMRYAWRNYSIYGVLSPDNRLVAFVLELFPEMGCGGGRAGGSICGGIQGYCRLDSPCLPAGSGSYLSTRGTAPLSTPPPPRKILHHGFPPGRA